MDSAQAAAPVTPISLVITPPTDVSEPGKSALDTNKFIWTPASPIVSGISANTGTDTLQADTLQPTLVDSSSCQNLISMC